MHARLWIAALAVVACTEADALAFGKRNRTTCVTTTYPTSCDSYIGTRVPYIAGEAPIPTSQPTPTGSKQITPIPPIPDTSVIPNKKTAPTPGQTTPIPQTTPTTPGKQAQITPQITPQTTGMTIMINGQWYQQQANGTFTPIQNYGGSQTPAAYPTSGGYTLNYGGAGPECADCNTCQTSFQGSYQSSSYQYSGFYGGCGSSSHVSSGCESGGRQRKGLFGRRQGGCN